MSRHAKRHVRAQEHQNSDILTAEAPITRAPAHEADIDMRDDGEPAMPGERDECIDDRLPPQTSEARRATTVLHSAMGQAFVEDAQAGPAAWLREAREDKGLTLDDIARTTKISLGILVALEAGDMGKLPATIFTRGFVKAYAKEVGLDPEETADLYLAQLAPETLAADAAVARLKVATPVARTEVMAFEKDNARLIKTQQTGRFGPLMLLAAVVGLVLYLGSFRWDAWTSKADANDVAQAPPADVAPAAVTPAPAGDAAPAALIATAEGAGGPLQFEMKPQGPCWLSAAADGNQVLSELLQAGDNRTIEVRDELVLRVGDPGACSFSINGRTGRPLGPAGAPVNVRITKDNFREFLSS